MATLLATVAALEKRLGLGRALTTAEQGRAEAALEDASDLVREEARQAWPADCPPAVVVIVLESAKRGFLNPGGYSSETSGPFTVRRDAVGVYLTEDEAGIVQRYRPGSDRGRAGLWTQATTRQDSCRDDVVLLADQYGGDPFLYGDRG